MLVTVTMAGACVTAAQPPTWKHHLQEGMVVGDPAARRAARAPVSLMTVSTTVLRWLWTPARRRVLLSSGVMSPAGSQFWTVAENSGT